MFCRGLDLIETLEKIKEFFSKFEGTEKDVTRGFDALDLNEENAEGDGAAPEGFLRMKYGKQLVRAARRILCSEAEAGNPTATDCEQTTVNSRH